MSEGYGQSSDIVKSKGSTKIHWNTIWLPYVSSECWFFGHEIHHRLRWMFFFAVPSIEQVTALGAKKVSKGRFLVQKWNPAASLLPGCIRKRKTGKPTMRKRQIIDFSNDEETRLKSRVLTTSYLTAIYTRYIFSIHLSASQTIIICYVFIKMRTFQNEDNKLHELISDCWNRMCKS